jgi:tryptophan synthase alpha subunit
MVSRVADGVIVGSAIVSLLEQTVGQTDQLERAGDFVSSLKAATVQ